MALHKDLTGTDLHEPKGIATASAGTVYIADGAASGAWTALSDRTPAGVVADWAGPVAPSGWAEADGSDLAQATYTDLYTNMTIQQSGARTNTSALVTGLSSTTNMKAGYYVFATGVAAGTTIVSVDSSSQITLSAAATSTTTNTVYVSPWYVTGTTIRLPDTRTSGRFRRSRTSSVHMGVSQADQNAAHTHTGTTDNESAHTHTGTTLGESALHTHAGTTSSNGAHGHTVSGGTIGGTLNTANPGGGGGSPLIGASIVIDSGGAHTHTMTTGTESADHTHTFTTAAGSAHNHAFTTGSSGGTEARPLSIVLMTIVRVT